ncbi:MAG: hypothetical protein WCG34_06675 [Leptolinea sp.]
MPIFMVFLVIMIIGQHNANKQPPQEWSEEDQDMMDQVVIMDAWDEQEPWN